MKNLLDKIIALELDMFLAVRAKDSYTCRQDPEAFRLHRRAQFSIWSEDTLQSYCNDLHHAQKSGINLMTVKYARMDNLLPTQHRSPLISDIVSIQVGWQKKMLQKYPHLMAGARHIRETDTSTYTTSFEAYLRSELETYSENTLELLHRDMLMYVKRGVNGSKKIYEYLVHEMGYRSIEEADQVLQFGF